MRLHVSACTQSLRAHSELGTVTHAFSNGEFQQAADTVQIAPEAPSENLCSWATRLASERIESAEIVLRNSKRNHWRLLLTFDVQFGRTAAP
jgi:hypothetical protein